MRSALYPPNSHHVSDEVIGTVTSRRRRPQTSHAASPNSSSTYRHDAGRDVIPASTSPLSTTPTATVVPPDQDENTRKVTRERRRLTQIRYRQKLKDHADTLEHQVRALRQQVQQLELQRRTISPRVITDTTSWKVVAEYYRIFQFALTAYAPVSRRCSSPSSPLVFETQVHRDFLQQAMVPSVAIDEVQGVERMLERWRFVSISQPNFEMKVVHLENGPDESIVATTKISIVMCRSMLYHTFPNLHKSERGRRLAARLLGQPFEINGSIRFTCDSDKGCMRSIQNQSDVMMPVMRFLGNLEDVAFIFDDDYSQILARRLLSPSA